jgi:hypothetical protein
MKKLFKTILHMGIGFIFGVTTMSYLSMHASSSFLEMVRLNYQMEQQIMAIHAKKSGNMNEAVLHYSNLVSASSSPGLYCFNKNRKYWSMAFPIASVMLERVTSTGMNSGKKKIEGINRALFADALEKARRKEEATSEYLKASNLLACDDIGKVKEIATKHMKYEEELLKLQDQYIYPQNLTEKPVHPSTIDNSRE